ncbi:hypothetical protein [Candidatus Neoehrlichia procyonis]|uniref:Uncharacterized protein n=1 Tax=Candidatus Neoehrlichia procyonis str. RAC413 TaxID=1359163 RepID=A0A0F3NNH5_9RICK|nr:hypothetical protein [Candidatus Neoehrlichia lotoris]KJV69595.1 hypothetical protein NLO413_0991 [Candidatus Neoehrlichia lotoris str. RAC413]
MLGNLRRALKNNNVPFGKAIVTIGSLLSSSLKVINNILSFTYLAKLNPDFGKQRDVTISGVQSQVIFKQQFCNYVPDKFFKKSTGNMFIKGNNLIYNNKKYPVIQLHDDDGNPIYDINGNALFAINTNNQEKIFKDLHLGSRVKNTIPVIACKDNIPIQVRSHDGRVMKRLKDIKLNPFSMRIKSLESNTTNWILTLALMPLYVFGDIIRFSLGAVQGVLKHISNFFNKCANSLEEKMDCNIINKSTGVLINQQSDMGLVVAASIFRLLGLIVTGFMMFIKNAKDIGEALCKVGNTFLNAMYNADDLQKKSGVAVLKKVSTDCYSDLRNGAKQLTDHYKLYKLRFSRDGKALSTLKGKIDQCNNMEKIAVMKENDNQNSMTRQRKHIKRKINANDKEEIKKVGMDLSKQQVLYGASEELHDYSQNQRNISTVASQNR